MWDLAIEGCVTLNIFLSKFWQTIVLQQITYNVVVILLTLFVCVFVTLAGHN